MSISWVCDILYKFHLIMDYFLGFALLRFPSFRGFYHVISGVIIIFPSYYLKIGLAIHLHFHFSKVGVATHLLLLLCGLVLPHNC